MEAALADGLSDAGATLIASGSGALASRRLLPACGLSGARATRLPASVQATWWRAGRRLSRVGASPDVLPGHSADLDHLLAAHDPVERRLGQILTVDPASVAGPMAALFSAGGKRIRARLVLLAGEIGGRYRPDQLLQGAAAMEILHAATLCHDDLVDGAASRRGYRRLPRSPVLWPHSGSATTTWAGPQGWWPGWAIPAFPGLSRGPWSRSRTANSRSWRGAPSGQGRWLPTCGSRS